MVVSLSPFRMSSHRIVSGALAVSTFLIALPAFAVTEDGGSSSSVGSKESVRVERCKRFSKGDDYERCLRIIRRLPARSTSSSSTSSAASSVPLDPSDKEWKWENILKRMEDKIASTVKFVSVMGKEFCKDRTLENETTSRECMARLKESLRTRLEKVLDEVFRGDLPSSR